MREKRYQLFFQLEEKHLYEKVINSILLSAINSRSNLKKVKLFLLSRVPPEILIVILLKMG